MTNLTIYRKDKKSNYTKISNDFCRDKRLSWKAKGILTQLLTLSPEWDFSVSGLASLASDGIESVRSGLKELEKYGYLSYTRNRANGKIFGADYVIYESPELNPNHKPCTEKPCTENPYEAEPYEAETPQLNIQLNKKINIINNQSHQSTDEIDEIDNATRVCSVEERDEYLRIIRSNIDYAYISDKKDVDEIVELMLDVICSTGKTVRTNSGDMPHEVVKQRFLELNGEHIDYVLTALRKNTTKVHNIRAYLITMLYNAPTTYKSYYTSWVNHDMYG